MSKTNFNMPRILAGLAFTASAALLFTPPAALAQGPGGPGGPPPPGRHWGGPGPGPGPGGFEHGPAKVVTGEPYSGQAVTSMTETLSNGATITRQITASIARDNDGRTMRTETFNGFGAAGSTTTGATITTIFDPVANERIELNSKSKTARIFMLPPPPSGSGSGQPHGNRNHANSNSKMSVQTESLGTQTINGVSAQGTQTTRTIAAGVIGNNQPLVSTEQRWYSPDLQIVVQSSSTDPRFGQTTYTINNLHSGEPSASLFQIPAGYQSKTIQVPARGAAQ